MPNPSLIYTLAWTESQRAGKRGNWRNNLHWQILRVHLPKILVQRCQSTKANNRTTWNNLEPISFLKSLNSKNGKSIPGEFNKKNLFLPPKKVKKPVKSQLFTKK